MLDKPAVTLRPLAVRRVADDHHYRLLGLHLVGASARRGDGRHRRSQMRLLRKGVVERVRYI
jgi:hypothetical protein